MACMGRGEIHTDSGGWIILKWLFNKQEGGGGGGCAWT